MIEALQIESSLGSWTQAHWAPAADDSLSGVVERVWDFEGTLAARREQTFPNGFAELIVQLDEPHRPVLASAGSPFPALCVDGLQTTTTTVEGPRTRCRVLGIRLHPCGAYALLRHSLRDMTDQCVDLDAALGAAAAELGQTLEAERSGQRRIASAVRWVRARMAKPPAVEPLVERALRRIDRDGGAVTLAQLEELVGRSRSRFAAAFRDHVGLSPKRYARIVRFRRALELLGAGPQPLHGVALSAGYYDQAHMNAEFREHAGLTPGEYLRAMRYPYSDHLTLPV